MEKIIITGGSGFIGSHLMQRLEGNQITSLDRSNAHGSQKGVNYAKCDVLEPKRLEKFTKGADAIIHLAALRSIKDSVEMPLEYNKVNIDGAVNVLEAARKNDVRKFVFASSSAVYGSNYSLPQKEGSLAVPSNPYGLSKLAGENYCRIYSENYGIEAVSLRMFNVYGPGQDPKAGVAAAFAYAAAKNTRPILYGSGKQARDFVYIEDVAQAFSLALKNSKKAKGLSINIGGGKSSTVNQILEIAQQLAEKKLDPEKKQIFLGDVRETLADISLAKKSIGWTPKTGLEEGMKKTFDFYRGAISVGK
ncbi:MAG: NAD-dependent epimerase/dehydratase family protein [archaeon]|nr:NAD-dependent epimerase/dehydratase family protein [archaeon]